jgi:N-acetylglutamate synthase-like GNAT family acetyltransferase
VRRYLPLLRPARLADASDLHRNCFSGQSLAEVQDYLRWCLAQADKGRMVRLVVQIEGNVVANGQLTIMGRQGEIGSLIVAPEYRRQGIGQALLQALIHQAREQGLCTLEIWARADVSWLRSWYERRGFTFLGERMLPREGRTAVLRMTLE